MRTLLMVILCAEGKEKGINCSRFQLGTFKRIIHDFCFGVLDDWPQWEQIQTLPGHEGTRTEGNQVKQEACVPS